MKSNQFIYQVYTRYMKSNQFIYQVYTRYMKLLVCIGYIPGIYHWTSLKTLAQTQTTTKTSLKLAEWVAKNLADELGLPDSGDQWTSEELNSILTRCLVSDRRGDNLYTFHSVEFESDLYQGVMREQCYQFNMAQHSFHGKNMKVSQ